MFFLTCLAIAVLLALLRGGNLGLLASAHIRWPGLILLGFVIQLVVFSPLWEDQEGLLAYSPAAYLVSLLVLLVALAVNLRLPGMALVLFGFALNFIVILANGGYMPASPLALQVAGMPAMRPGEVLTNSIGMAVSTPFAFLGDIFSIPKSAPFANIFSIGDVVIAIGSAYLVYTLTTRRQVVQAEAEETLPTPATSLGTSVDSPVQVGSVET